jgi:hypothetical protein
MAEDSTPNASARPGGQAKDGVSPSSGDPDTPKAARRRHAGDGAAHRDAGFGDDKGGDAE